MEEISKMGRPAHSYDEKTAKQIKMLAAMGVPDFDIAKVVGMSSPTMRKYYTAELEVGHIEANAQVAQSLFKQATNTDKPNVAAAIFWMKCRAGWSEQHDEMGKKEAAKALAKAADVGTSWEGLLE
jgi:hypothetical protein